MSIQTGEREGNRSVQEVRHQPAVQRTDPVAQGQSDGSPGYGVLEDDTGVSLAPQTTLTRHWRIPVEGHPSWSPRALPHQLERVCKRFGEQECVWGVISQSFETQVILWPPPNLRKLNSSHMQASTGTGLPTPLPRLSSH